MDVELPVGSAGGGAVQVGLVHLLEAVGLASLVLVGLLGGLSELSCCVVCHGDE
jgi:hypothetical protein